MNLMITTQHEVKSKVKYSEMLSTMPSQRRSVESSQDLKSPEVLLDSALPLISFDSVDNPLLKQNLEKSVTGRNILQHMKSECNRLYSFQNKWPLHNITPESLAEAGFFYLQQEDRVQCPFCELITFNWTQGDKPLREHIKKSPKCLFLMGQDVGNITLSEKKLNINPRLNISLNCENVTYKPKNPRMSDVKLRLLTYSSWPLNEPEPQQLAECGLYYSGVADVVTCFFCGGTLGNWEPDDDPWLEHVKFFPECTFLELAKDRRRHLLKEKTCVKSIDQKPLVHNLSSTNTNSEIVQQALNIFPKDLVLQAVKKRFGSPFSLQEICDDILELKQKSEQPKSVSTTTQPGVDTETPSALKVDFLCKVCMDRERGVVFQPCGHFVTCWNCSNLIADCPVCRRPINHRIRAYIS